MRLKIALVVHGRFFVFDLARELLRQGHDVTVLTNYPRWAAARFGVPVESVRSFWAHGVLSRSVEQFGVRYLNRSPETWLHPLFGRWATEQLRKEDWDVVCGSSGVSEEFLRELAGRALLQVSRASAHIRTQAALLRDESVRTGTPLPGPGPWIIAREEREYHLADQILTVSSFVHNTFLKEGVSGRKLALLPLGAELSRFRPSAEIHQARRDRIVSGAPLRVLYVGALSFRKGLYDLAHVVRDSPKDQFEFRLVGARSRETHRLLAGLADLVTLVPHQPQATLPVQYAWGDVFILPSIEDGYQAVLGQAAASGLPIITTPNGAGYDLIQDGLNGWVVPIRTPRKLLARLRWCGAQRAELVEVVDRVSERYQPRDWSEVARDFVTLASGKLATSHCDGSRDPGPDDDPSSTTPQA
jgi:glycosyltransferase involved in cell wall biosynthesis